ncbi:MAG: hypothetical protein U0517_01645 [Candidatus Andersenbacteria bacterium]
MKLQFLLLFMDLQLSMNGVNGSHVSVAGALRLAAVVTRRNNLRPVRWKGVVSLSSALLTNLIELVDASAVPGSTGFLGFLKKLGCKEQKTAQVSGRGRDK